MSDSQRARNKRSAVSTGANGRGEAGLDTSSSTLIPLPLTSLVGRERDVAQVTTLLQSGQTRLLTLTGPGGVGKTRLALQVAAGTRGSFSDGAFFISLAPISNPDLVLSTIAQTLGVTEAPGQSILQSLCSGLRDKHTLLILDNFEQVVSAGPQVLDLLLCAPRLHALVTSRTVLHVYGEQEYQVPPLSLPNAQQRLSLDQLTQYEAVRLFIERARAVKPEFTVTNDNAPAVAEICHRLDGLPLAIELAAARIKLMSPHSLLKRLDHTLPLLTRGATSLPYRHQTLHNAIAWSYDLLDEDERSLFRRLSVFVGGCTLQAAEAVCASYELRAGDNLHLSPALRASGTPYFDLLAALVDKSLLLHDEQEDGEPRFSMLETIREFALDELEASGKEEATRERHVRYFLELAEQAEPELVGANQSAWLDTLAREHDNLRSALLWAQQTGDAETGLRIAGALWRFWNIRGHWSEGQRWLREALECGNDAPPAIRAKAFNGLGILAHLQGNYDAARNYHEQDLALGQELGDKREIARALGNLGNTAQQLADFARSKSFHEQSLALYRELGQKWAEAIVLSNLGIVLYEQEDYENARRTCEEALLIQRALGNKSGIALSLNNLGIIAAAERNYTAARAYYEESLSVSRETGDKQATARSLQALGEISAEEGDYQTACALQSTSLRARYELGHRRGMVDCLQGLAVVAREKAEPRRLVRLLAAAEALCAAIGAPITTQDRRRYDKWLAVARERLGPHAFASAWEKGKALTLEEAIALALEEAPAPTPGTFVAPSSSKISASESRSDLTPREVEVLQLVAAGLTNPGIAAHLHLSIGTVQTHMSSIFSKINVNTRGAAVRYAFEHNLS